MTLQSLEGRVALVTGGARGIGLAISRSLRDAGMTVVLTDQDEDGLEHAVADLGDAAVTPAVLDVCSDEQWEHVVSDTCARFGAVDVLCNNAGIGIAAPSGTPPYRSWEVPAEKVRQVLDVNFGGVLRGMRAVVPRMIERGRPGHIVNTASMAGFLAPPYLATYASSKFAVVALSESTAAELEEFEIGVSILCPGGVATPFNESARRLGAGSTAPRPRRAAPSDETKMDPSMVGDRVVRAIRSGELYVFTHPEYEPLVEDRNETVLSSFRASAQPGYRDPQDLLERSRNPLHARRR